MSHMTLATPETDNEETTNVRGALPHSASVARPAAEVWTTAPPPIRKTRVRRISRWLLLLAALGGLIVLAAAFFAGKEEPPREAAPQSQSANAMRVSIVHPKLHDSLPHHSTAGLGTRVRLPEFIFTSEGVSVSPVQKRRYRHSG